MRGLFIVIEGGDAVGKATQSQAIVDIFGARRIAFPRYDTPLGSLIKQRLVGKGGWISARQLFPAVSSDADDALADALVFQSLMFIDRYAAASQIEAWLKVGFHVVADRWWQSSLAYGSYEGLDPGWILDAAARLPEADLNILIDLPPEEARKRRPEARDKYEENRDLAEHVRDVYTDLWAARARLPDASPDEPQSWLVVDGNRRAFEVTADIAHIVRQRLPKTS